MQSTALSFWSQKVQNEYDEYRQPTRVFARIPSETNCTTCGWDPVNQSAYDMECPTCKGIGKIVSWTTYAVYARLIWNPLRFAYPFPSSGVELGDCIIVVSREWESIMDAVMNEERAYLQADDHIVRPKFKHEQRIGNLVTEIEYECNLFHPESQ